MKNSLVQAMCADCPHFQRQPTSPRAAQAQLIEHNGIYHPERLERPADRPLALEEA